MRVFMLGWEFPPHISGGLGTACYGLTKGLDEIGVSVCFVLPQAVPVSGASHVQLRSPADLAQRAGEQGSASGEPFEHVEIHQVDATLQPYGTPESYEKAIRQLEDLSKQLHLPTGAPAEQQGQGDQGEVPTGTFRSIGGHYGLDLMAQVQRYARLVVELALVEAFDVIHAHDWMTYPAGLAVAAASGKPLVVHVHSTEFDRAGENVDQQVYEIERTGMLGARKVVCVSHLTRNIVAKRYGVAPERIDVVYNAVDLHNGNNHFPMTPIRHNEKIVLFLGRLTMQKGPEYFLRSARKVVDRYPNVRFVVTGSGDMIAQCVEEVAALKLGRHVTFTGFLRGDDVDRVFSMADLYVMPSVSEPFGIAALEALSHNVPIIISKQSGVAEVITHALKVDFWDIDEMANKILAVLKHPPLQRTLRQHGAIEMRKLSWRDSARKLSDIYRDLVRG